MERPSKRLPSQCVKLGLSSPPASFKNIDISEDSAEGSESSLELSSEAEIDLKRRDYSDLLETQVQSLISDHYQRLSTQAFNPTPKPDNNAKRLLDKLRQARSLRQSHLSRLQALSTAQQREVASLSTIQSHPGLYQQLSDSLADCVASL